MEILAKITSKGQVTIPKRIRNLMETDLVKFRVEGGKVILEPVRDVGGIFKEYAKKAISREEEREIAWKKVADGYRGNLS